MDAKPKLLHIALGDHNQGLWKAFDKHFKTLHYNWIPFKEDPDKVNQDIKKHYTRFKPDVVFMQIQKEGVINLEIAKMMTKKSIVLNWTGDVRFPLPQWFVELGRHITLSLFSNMFDVLQMKQQGVNADFLQVGFDPEIFHPFGETIQSPKIVFLGSNYIASHNFPLSRLRYQMVARLKQEFGANFTPYGSGWSAIAPESKYLKTNEEADIYRSCDIAVNLSHFDYGRYSSDRIFRLMGSGAFCLTHEYKDVEKDFNINEHLATWSNIEELVTKIKYYLANIYERETMRKQGCQFVRQECNWDKRFAELKQLTTTLK